MAKQVLVYSSTGCVTCGRVKEYLKHKGIEFQERDVIEDPSAMDDLTKLGLMTTPVTLVDGVPLVGFDQTRFDEVFGGVARDEGSGIKGQGDDEG